jgi:hypothetical protein
MTMSVSPLVRSSTALLLMDLQLAILAAVAEPDRLLARAARAGYPAGWPVASRPPPPPPVGLVDIDEVAALSDSASVIRIMRSSGVDAEAYRAASDECSLGRSPYGAGEGDIAQKLHRRRPCVPR